MTEMSNGIESVNYTSLKGEDKKMSNIIANGIESVIYTSLKSEEKKVSTNHFQVLRKAQAYR